MLEQILLGIWPPLALAVPLLLLGAWRRAAWTVPLALGGALFVALAALEGVPPLPAITGTQWLAWGAIAVAVLGAVDAGRPLRRLPFWSAALVLLLATSGAALARLWANQWNAAEGALHVAAAAAVGVALAAAFAAPARAWPPLAALVGACTCAAGGYVLMRGGSALLGQLAGALGAVLAAAAAAAFFRPVLRLRRGSALALGLALGGLLVQGRLFADAALAPLVFTALAPAALLAEGALRTRPPRLRAAVVLGIAAVPLLLAVLSAGGVEDPYAAYR